MKRVAFAAPLLVERVVERSKGLACLQPNTGAWWGMAGRY